MKEDINLLPPRAQKERMKKMYRQRLRRLYNSFIAAMFLIGCGEVAAYIVQHRAAEALEEQVSAAALPAADSNGAREVNAKISYIYRQFRQHPAWTLHVTEALRQALSTITITNLEVDSASQVITIGGVSSSRSDVLELEQRLRSLSWAKSVDAPLQNFATGPSITFRFSITREL
jgi:Tfp pilus assembly protein PilN